MEGGEKKEEIKKNPAFCSEQKRGFPPRAIQAFVSTEIFQVGANFTVHRTSCEAFSVGF